MLLILSVFYESFLQAFHQLWSNKLRTFLSLLGITIGIWCIIMVFSSVNSLENSIRESMQELGNDVVYITTMPWGEDPREDFWKYMRRPDPNHREYKALKRKLDIAELVSYQYVIGSTGIDYVNTNASNVFFLGVTDDYQDVFNLKFEQGRYFTSSDFYRGINGVILGNNVATTLFRADEDPIGKTVKVKGQKMKVIGVLEKEGNDLLNPINFDNVAIVPYNTSRKFVNTNRKTQGRVSITVKAAPEISMDQLKDGIVAVLRSERRLTPKEENDFELNTLSILTALFESLFSAINGAGWFIGGFAIIVGVFSVANIMFVSVKERTALIGVKKALGAKRFVILLEFLIESIVLCLLGGILGLVFVYLATIAATSIFEFEIYLSMGNIITGLMISAVSGVLAGIVPAYSAAGLPPVEAMRTGL